MAPSELRIVLERYFPRNATCWSQATDEVRDLARSARLMRALPESEAFNFRAATINPSAWNSGGVDYIIEHYQQMPANVRADFIQQVTDLLRCASVDFQ